LKESSGSSGLRTYVLTRLGLALPTVLIPDAQKPPPLAA